MWNYNENWFKLFKVMQLSLRKIRIKNVLFVYE